MSIEVWITFVAASMVLLIMPGPTILTVISYSIAHGYKAKTPLILAVALGDSVALAVSLLGLGVLLSESVFWFGALKWVGGLYLILLGIRLFRAANNAPSISNPDLSASSWAMFLNTFLVTALNPKGIIFFVAFLPQFITHNADAGLQLWVLASTFVILATLNASMYAVFAGRAKQMLASAKTQKRFNVCGAVLLCSAGALSLVV
jgi:threonine/homoserine/homoserine lactone efflux protein